MSAVIDAFDVDTWLRQPHSAQLHVSKPYQIGCWTKGSVNQGAHLRHGDTSGLHPFEPPILPADLSVGYPSDYTKKPEDVPDGMEPVLEAVLQANYEQQCDLCTFRNNLNKIFSTPLDLKTSWAVDACKIEKIIYLDIHKLPQHSYADAELFQYYGYKFEALCTAQAAVDATSEYAALIRLRIDKLRILMATEIDCFDPQKCKPGADPDLGCYLELKTYQVPENEWKARNIKRFKYPKWWLQSWLAGVPSIVAGARDKQGMLQKIDVLSTHELPKLAADANVAFDPWQQIHFGKDVLTWIQTLTGTRTGQHLRFVFDGRASSHRINCYAVDQGQLPDRIRATWKQQAQQNSRKRART